MMSGKQITLNEFPITPVNSASPIPLYYQVEADLRHLIKSDAVRSGDLLPTEIELSRAYGVGRHTIRTALGRLAVDQLISRKAGHGTVVNAERDRRHFSLAQSFSAQMHDLGLTPHSVVLQKTTGTISQHDPHELHDLTGAACLHLVRLRYGSEEPIGWQHSIILTEHCPALEGHDFVSRSLYAVLSHEYSLEIAEIRHTVGAINADKKQAELLNIELRSALLVVHTTASLNTGEMIEFSTSYYRADKYEYSTRQTSN
jgi:GntR family transcriptional regulator